VGPLVSDTGNWFAAHWVDVNNDGHPDLWVQGADFESPYAAVVSPLYLNLGSGGLSPSPPTL
jgi:hypothetical protein